MRQRDLQSWFLFQLYFFEDGGNAGKLCSFVRNENFEHVPHRDLDYLLRPIVTL